jgi:hypothetical protein
MSGLDFSPSAVPRECGGITSGAEDGKNVLRSIEEDLHLQNLKPDK